MARVILHVLCVGFHHRNGPTLEYAHPPFPSAPHSRSSSDQPNLSISLPNQWSFMPFMCLPDGAHASDEEFIYFHLPPIPEWPTYPQSTIFGLACFRQIDAKDLINKTADVTRTKVQKAVVVLASQPILGSIRSKLGLVTQAFFAQRDFTKTEILDTLYESLDISVRAPFTDTTLHMGISLREIVYKFRHKLLQLFKLLLLGKRILFFGQKVERLSAYQYGLISLFPELLRHLEDVGSPDLDCLEIKEPAHRKLSLESHSRSMELLRQHQSESHKYKLFKLGYPLRLFGKGAFFQPYIPLQQIDVIMSPNTKSFVVGTSNSIFIHHRACAIDVVAYADDGSIEFINPQVTSLVTLTSADRKFMDELIKPVVSTWSAEDDMTLNQQIDFEGSDDDIRTRFEGYLTQLIVSIRKDGDASATNIGTEPSAAKKVDYLSEYHLPFVKAWETTKSFATWKSIADPDVLSMFNPGHPYHGYSALGEMQTQLSARLTEIGRSMPPISANITRAFASNANNPASATSKSDSVASAGSNSGNAASALQTASNVVANAASATASATAQVAVSAMAGTGYVASTVSSSVSETVASIADHPQTAKIQASASQLLSNVSAWYAQKRKEWTENAASAPKPTSIATSGISKLVPNTKRSSVTSSSSQSSLPVAQNGGLISDETRLMVNGSPVVSASSGGSPARSTSPMQNSNVEMDSRNADLANDIPNAVTKTDEKPQEST